MGRSHPVKHEHPQDSNRHRNVCRDWSVEPGTNSKNNPAVYLRLGRHFEVFLNPTTATNIANALIDALESQESRSFQHHRMRKYYAISDQITADERKAT